MNSHAIIRVAMIRLVVAKDNVPYNLDLPAGDNRESFENAYAVLDLFKQELQAQEAKQKEAAEKEQNKEEEPQEPQAE